MRIAFQINFSLFVEKSHRSPFDKESKLWKLALLIDVFERKTRSHLDLSDTNQTLLGAKDSHHNPKVYSVIVKRTKNCFSDSWAVILAYFQCSRSSEVASGEKFCFVWRATRQRNKSLCHVLNCCSYGNTSVEAQA